MSDYGAHSPCYCPKHQGLYVRKVWCCIVCGHGTGCGHPAPHWGWRCRSVQGKALARARAKRQG
jgi:hypothetical protein